MLIAANLVLAEESRIEMSKLTCKQFAAYDKDNMSIIMMWLEGYYTRRTRTLSSTSGWPVTLRVSSSIAATILMTTLSRPQTKCWAGRERSLRVLAFPGSVMI